MKILFLFLFVFLATALGACIGDDQVDTDTTTSAVIDGVDGGVSLTIGLTPPICGPYSSDPRCPKWPDPVPNCACKPPGFPNQPQCCPAGWPL